MKLTLKDKDFLERLRILLGSKDLAIELKYDGLKRFVLRQNYGDQIESAFNLTRQGVRWRFQRLFNEIYVSAYECIYVVESLFGTDLRHKAMEIATQIARAAPLGVQGSLKASRFSEAHYHDQDATVKQFMTDLSPVMNSEDSKEGINSFLERRDAVFTGK